MHLQSVHISRLQQMFLLLHLFSHSSCAQSAAPEEDAKTVNAPIVGVFYAASAPGKAPFAPVGKKVSKGSTVCIIEAMKCMNEIQAEDDYEIVEVLVKDGDLVEYGQPLFKVK